MLIILADDEALAFGIKYRDDLFKNVPIVFLGIENNEIINKTMDYDLVSGVVEVESVDENIQLIQTLHKDTKKIVFLYKNDKSAVKNNFNDENSAINNIYNNSILKYKELRFEKINISDISLDEFISYLNTLDKDEAIISFFSRVNSNNEIKVLNRLIREQAEDVPMYEVLSYGVGYGSIGGKVINHYRQGRKAGEIVRAIFNGENPKTLHIDDDSTNEYIFDYNVLREFGIRKNKLPYGSTILNKPIDLIKEYKGVIIDVLLLIIVLVFTVAILMVYMIYKKNMKKSF